MTEKRKEDRGENEAAMRLPLGDLPRERARRAIGGIAQAEVLVDLQQPLLDRRRFSAAPAAPARSPKRRVAATSTRRFVSSARSARKRSSARVSRAAASGRKTFSISSPMRESPTSAIGARRRLRGQRVMALPVRIAQAREKLRQRAGFALREHPLELAPVADDLRERGEPALRMIRRALAAELPEIGRAARGAKTPPGAPTISPTARARTGASRRASAREIAIGQKAAHAEEQRIDFVLVLRAAGARGSRWASRVKGSLLLL